MGLLPLKNHFKKESAYFLHTMESHFTAIVAVISLVIFIAFQLLLLPKGLYVISAMLSIMLLNIYMVKIFGASINTKLLSGIIVSLLFGVFAFIGAYFFFLNIFVYSIVLIILLLATSFSQQSPPHVSVAFWIVTDLFIIYPGIQGNFHASLLVGLMAGLGGLFFILVLWIKNFIIHPSKYREMVQQPLFPDKIFNFTRANLVYGVRLCVTVVFANSVAYYFKMPFGYWLPMTVFILSSPLDKEVKKVMHRFVGTVFGCLTAFPLIYYVSNRYILGVFVLVSTYGFIIGLGKHYGSYTFFLTFAVLSVLALGNHAWLQASLEYRFIATVLGLFIVLVIIYFQSLILKYR